ncbi:MAG: hypothetical protein H7836_13280 [Magnetococcus sp. YQC-3]
MKIKEERTEWGLAVTYILSSGNVVLHVTPDIIDVEPIFTGNNTKEFKNFKLDLSKAIEQEVNKWEYEDITFHTYNDRFVDLICQGKQKAIGSVYYPSLEKDLTVYQVSVQDFRNLKDELCHKQ